VKQTTSSFKITITNCEYIGKTSNELVAKWNTDSPTDQVAFSEN